jgi:imidazolonepropionase-like amidohydrolase
MATVRIQADQLVPGEGEPIPNAVVVLDGPTITFAGPAADAPDTPQADVTTVSTVMPGLWDCHAHLMGLAAGVVNLEALITQTPQIGAVRSARDLGAALDAGVTSVREVGGYAALLAPAVDEGTVRSPHLYGAGSVLSQTGGHGDMHGLSPADSDRMWERLFGAPSLADGPDDCRRIVRRQLRLGARVIKVCASGGVMSQIDHPIHQQFSAEELAAIVDEASRADRAVAAHCHGKPGIMAAVEAGVRTIEHGSYLDEEAAVAMRESDTILVPTRWIVDHLMAVGRKQGMPEYAAVKIEAIADRHREAVETAIEHGVTIAAGTDIWGAGMWGRNGEEAGLLAEIGLSPLQALAAATANAPATLGAQAPHSGRLTAGYDADVIALDIDPLADLSLLSGPDHVTHVWKAGVPMKWSDVKLTENGGRT